jgi:hypothetical protein
VSPGSYNYSHYFLFHYSYEEVIVNIIKALIIRQGNPLLGWIFAEGFDAVLAAGRLCFQAISVTSRKGNDNKASATNRHP